MNVAAAITRAGDTIVDIKFRIAQLLRSSTERRNVVERLVVR